MNRDCLTSPQHCEVCHFSGMLTADEWKRHLRSPKHRNLAARKATGQPQPQTLVGQCGLDTRGQFGKV